MVLSFPVIAYQIYKFVAPGLYKNEKMAFLPYLVISPLLFLVGASMVFFFIFPYVLEFGLRQQQAFSTGASVTLLPKVSEYLGLATTLFIAFGLSFQLPVVLSLLGRVGIVSSMALRKGRRYAVCWYCPVRCLRDAARPDYTNRTWACDLSTLRNFNPECAYD